MDREKLNPLQESLKEKKNANQKKKRSVRAGSRHGRRTSVCLGGAAHAEKWPGDDAPIPGAIAARVIAVKCNGFLDPQAITELDSYIDRSATDFMAKSESTASLPRACSRA